MPNWLRSKLGNESTNDKRRALHQAAAKGLFEDVQQLLKKGVKVKAKDKPGRTALHWAA